MTRETHPDLPDTIARYFATSDRAEAAMLFAPDAEVKDEGHRHKGFAEIQDWLASVEQRYRPRYRVLGAQPDGAATIVRFEVSGTFPGSPAILQQKFTLDAAGRIASLETL